KKKVLAEGVSTKEQVEILRQLGCDKIQGFYFSRPLTAEKFEECLIAGGSLPLNGTPAPNP
ncbi:MAG TPA: EAL domain-containing protein, partial [Spirochaetia bacterium]|nr:EAL domain-containing protein [Spirochaetia bacterium]